MHEMPAEGGRIRIDLIDAQDGAARYRVRVLVGGAEHEGEGHVQGRTASLVGLEAAPEGLRSHALAILRQAAARAKDGRWPRRLMRWRTA